MSALHFSVDLETMSIASNAAIASIGIVPFDNDMVYTQEAFYVKVNWQEQEGSDIMSSTVAWWMEQDEEARKEITSKHDRVILRQALINFYDYIEIQKGLRPDVDSAYFWGNGAGFDFPILENAFARESLVFPFRYNQSMCFRTLRTQMPDDTRELIDSQVAAHTYGTKHNALDDAIWQAQWLVAGAKHGVVQFR